MSPHHIDLPGCQCRQELPFDRERERAHSEVNWGLLIIKLIIMIIKLTMIMIMVITMRRMGLTLITIMISPMIVDPCWPKDGNEQR